VIGKGTGSRRLVLDVSNPKYQAPYRGIGGYFDNLNNKILNKLKNKIENF
jgi:hypothetical protein